MTNLLRETIQAALHERYDPIPDFIQERVNQELFQAEYYSKEAEILALCHMLRHLKINNIPHWLSSTTASCVFFHLLGVARCNPLPTHYYCPHCKAVILVEDKVDGFDLPPRTCTCGHQTEGDGHNIPAEVFWGVYPDATAVNTLAQLPHVRIPVCHLQKAVALLQEKLPHMELVKSPVCSVSIGSIYLEPTIPDTRYMKEIPTRPINFGESVRWSGYSSATLEDVTWQVVQDCQYPIIRDEVYDLFVALGASLEQASQATDLVYRRKPLPDDLQAMLPEEMASYLQKVTYLFPKSHIAEFMLYQGATEDVDQCPVLDGEERRLWLLERLVSDFELALQQRGIAYLAATGGQRYQWKMEQLNPLTLLTVGENHITMDPQSYWQQSDEQWSYEYLFQPALRKKFVAQQLEAL